MSRSRRTLLLLYLAIGLASLVILASSISQLQLKTGTLFNEETIDELNLLLAQFAEYRGVLLVCAAIIPVLVLVSSLLQQARYQQRPEARRNSMLAVVLQLLLLVLALMIIRRRILEDENNPLNPGQIQAPIASIGENFERIPINIPQYAAFLVGFVLLVLGVIVLFWLAGRRRRDNISREEVKQDALEALNEIEQGFDLRDVIIRCYYEMTLAVERHRGIKRAEGMTPREFEYQLDHLGIPPEPVAQLTRIFEEVRYGGRMPQGETEELARTCLLAIASACGGSR